MATSPRRRPAPEVVEAPLKYLAAAGAAPPVYVASVGGGDATLHQGDYVMQSVAIRNGRLCEAGAEGFGLDREGFMSPGPRGSRSSTTPGAPPRWRCSRRAASASPPRSCTTTIPPARGRGACATTSPPPARARPRRPSRRFAIVNVWRSIGGRVLSAPLALCDAASVAPGDLVPVERRARDRIGEIQQAAYNPAHRWYYFPEMAPDEALLIKTYDSASDGRARFTIHTSFEDPAAPADAPPRESLETRCFVFF
jgi:hypothetical protein